MAALAKLRLGYELGDVDLADLLAAERLVGEAFRMESVIRVRIDSQDFWLRDQVFDPGI